MVRPVLLAVDDEPAARSSIEAELRKRYGADYEVICEGSGAAALGVVEQVTARGGHVALVLADQWMPDMTGIELLTKVHGLEPAAKRALLTCRWVTCRWVTVWSGRPSSARSTTGA